MKHTPDQILAKLKTICEAQNGGFAFPFEVTPDTKFTELDFDSLDMVELVMCLEEEFPNVMDFPDEETEKFLTIRDVAVYIETHEED